MGGFSTSVESRKAFNKSENANKKGMRLSPSLLHRHNGGANEAMRIGRMVFEILISSSSRAN